MAKFTPMLKAPAKSDKYYVNYENGGYSTAIAINEKTGWVLPNCVGHANARWHKLLGKKVDWSIPCCNAEDFMEYAKSKGFKTGSTPKLGAILVWSKGKKHNESDGCGHVGIVEEIKSNGDVIMSASNYNGTEFYTQLITKSSGYKFGSGYKFEGFIYPGIEYDSNPAPTPKTIENRYKVIKNGKQIEADTYLENAISTAKEKNAIVIDSTTGKQVYPKTTVTTSAKKENYNLNNIPNRFKVKKNGVQLAAYTTWSYAVNYAKCVGGVIVDGKTGEIIWK